MNGKPSKNRAYNYTRQAFTTAPLGMPYGMTVSTLTMQMQATLHQFAQALFHTSASMQSFANSMRVIGFDPALDFPPFPFDEGELDYFGEPTGRLNGVELRVLKCGDAEVRQVVGNGFVRRLDRVESLEERLGKQGTRVL